MMFKDRYDAALKLLPYLMELKGEPCVVLAIPRGGVPIGYYLSKYYGWPLEILMAKKIPHPWNHDLAIGAVSIEDYIIDTIHNVPEPFIADKIKHIRESLIERFEKFMVNRVPVSFKNKTVVIVNDGIATGSTMLTAIKLVQKKNPKKIIVAIPVAPVQTADKLKQIADEFICLHVPDDFIGVGQYYLDFSQVSDEEVMDLLQESKQFKELTR